MSAAGHSRGWGWHALADEWAARVVAHAAVRSGELVIDVGAGHGALTHHLLLSGARVVAVELHPGRAAVLRRRFAGASVRVVEGDTLMFRWPHRPFRVVANPSFASSAGLLRVLLEPHSRLVAADLVLQRAVVRRYTDPGRVSRRWVTRAGLSLPRHAFRPVPRVDSAVLVIRRR